MKLYLTILSVLTLGIFFEQNTIYAMDSESVIYVSTGEFSDNNSGKVVVIDSKSRTVIDSIFVGQRWGGGDMVKSPNGEYVYLAVAEANRIYKISVADRSLIDSAVVNRPTTIDITPDGKQILSISHGDSTLSIIDLEPGGAVHTVKAATWLVDIIVDPSGLLAYAAGTKIAVIDITQRKIINEIDINGSARRLAIDKIQYKLYAGNTSNHSIDIIALESQTKIQEIDWLQFTDAEILYEMYFDSKVGKLYFAIDHNLIVLNIETMDSTVLSSSILFAIRDIGLRSQRDAIFVTTGVRFSIDSGSDPVPGQVLILDKDGKNIIDTINTGFAPIALAMVEYPLPLQGDFNADGLIDFSDFILFAESFGSKRGGIQWNYICDLNEDGHISFTDFLEFVNLFLTEG